MIGRIVEIAEDKRYLSLHRGFMVVKSEGEEIGRISLDQIDGLIVSGHGTTHSSNLLAELAERGIPFVLCASNYLPVAILWPLSGNYHQSKRIKAQLAAKKPVRKRLWKNIVKAKLAMQAAVLGAVGQPTVPLSSLVPKVKSGDPDNLEAQGARRYWPLLLGKDFRRDRHAEDHNALLNYGYTIIRSATARGIAAAGLHPSLGLHHSSSFNPMGLADDLMEPFRPLVDLRVFGLVRSRVVEVNPDSKRWLAKLLYVDMPGDRGVSPLINVIYRLATSLGQLLVGEKDNLDLPESPDALGLDAICRYDG